MAIYTGGYITAVAKQKENQNMNLFYKCKIIKEGRIFWAVYFIHINQNC